MLETKIREEMIVALKNHEMEKKVTLSMVVDKLSQAAKEKKSPLTESEEGSILLKISKQMQESIDGCPDDDKRAELKNKLRAELELIKPYVPSMMSVEEINTVLEDVLSELGIEAPTAKDKGNIMKVLMPKLNGKADGKVVNEIISKKIS